MKTYDSAQIRNVALVGHGGTGKTTLAEAILFKSGATTRLGRTAEGTSTMDSSPEEIKRKISISLGLAPVEVGGCKINILDAPGFADFVGEAEAALYVADLAVIVVNATAGVEPETERYFDMVQQQGKPALFLINQMDKEDADFGAVVERIQSALTPKAVPFALPIGTGASFKGLVEVVSGQAFLDAGKGDSQAGEIPGELQAECDERRAALTEAAAESDDALLEKYLEAGELTADEMLAGLRAGVHAGTTYPILPMSAEMMVGLDRFLEFLIKWAPSPLEAPQPPALKEGQDEPVELDGRVDGSVLAFVFKNYFDERLGEFTLMRVYSGRLTPGDYYNSRKQTSVRVGALYAIRGKERVDLEALPCGDIGATPRLKNASVNDTLGAKDARAIVKPILFSEPLHTVAVLPTSRGEEEKVAGGFSRLQDLDPTFRVTVDSALRQTLISGMGDQHLDVMSERLKARNKVEIETKRPRIPYRETIQGRVEDIQGKYKKQTGGRGQYGDVHLKLEPQPRGEGFEFVDAIVGGVIPSKFIPAVEKGVRETMDRGVLVGYPVVDVKVTLHFGSYHDVDSSENAFKMAGTMAFKEGFLQCQPVLLEPIMKLTVLSPEEYTGDIMGDMSSRRGRIQGMERQGNRQVIQAEAPLGEIFGYIASLRSMTQGRGRFRAEVSHYELVPRDVQEKLVQALKAEMEEANA